MKTSNKALLVITPSTQNHSNLLRAAKEFLAKNGQLNIAYIMPKIPAVAHHVPEIALYAKMQADMGTNVLKELAQNLNIPASNLMLCSGSARSITRRVANQLCAKVIIADFASWQRQDPQSLMLEAAKKLWQQLTKWGHEFSTGVIIEPIKTHKSH